MTAFEDGVAWPNHMHANPQTPTNLGKPLRWILLEELFGWQWQQQNGLKDMVTWLH